MFPFDHSTLRSNPSVELSSKLSRVKGKQRAPHLRRRHSQSDSTLSHPSYPFIDPDQSHSPSNNTRLGLLPRAPVITRSASSPLFSTNTPGIYAHSTFSSTHSLRLDSRYNFGADDGTFIPVVKQLSPIAEQEYFSPEQQTLPLPAEDVTPSQNTTPTESQHSGIIRPSSAYSTFLTRPLNRSASQTSSRTHGSTSSVPPPSIPPLDFRPTFSGQTCIPPLRNPKPVAVRAMPTITGSSDDHIDAYDDRSSIQAESFKTAESLDLSQSEPDIMPAARLSTGRLGERGPHAGPSTMPSTDPRFSQASSFTSFFERRWRRSEGFGSGFATATFPKPQGPRFCISATPACWLFWAGFLAPWCWMIGGWYYTIRGQKEPKYGPGGGKEFLLPMWVIAKQGLDGVALTEKEAVSYGVWFSYPFVAPAVVKGSSRASVNSRSPPTIRAKKPKVLDPWITRCRIAAFTSGVLTIIAFITAFIVVGHTNG